MLSTVKHFFKNAKVTFTKTFTSFGSNPDLTQLNSQQYQTTDPQARIKQEEFMRIAIQASAETMREGKGGPFGSVITRNGEIVVVGANEVLFLHDLTAHAEVVAIRKACKELKTFRLDDCEMYTSCEPCPMCLGAIHMAGIKKVYYANSRKDADDLGFEVTQMYEEMSKPNEDRKYPMQRLLHDEARVVFEEWTNEYAAKAWKQVSGE